MLKFTNGFGATGTAPVTIFSRTNNINKTVFEKKNTIFELLTGYSLGAFQVVGGLTGIVRANTIKCIGVQLPTSRFQAARFFLVSLTDASSVSTVDLP